MSEIAPKRHQTYLKRGDDGRYMVTCRICPRSSWRFLQPDERVGLWLDTAPEAVAQGRRHRQSNHHQSQVIRAAKRTISDMDIAMNRIFGAPLPEPCTWCGFNHASKLDCLTAARIRDNELL